MNKIFGSVVALGALMAMQAKADVKCVYEAVDHSRSHYMQYWAVAEDEDSACLRAAFECDRNAERHQFCTFAYAEVVKEPKQSEEIR